MVQHNMQCEMALPSKEAGHRIEIIVEIEIIEEYKSLMINKYDNNHEISFVFIQVARQVLTISTSS